MDVSAITKQLEISMQMVLAPPHLVSPEQRHEAEEVLINFKNSKEPYEICRAILETSNLDAVMYQAATTLKEAMIREWSFLQEQTRASLQQFIFDYLINRPRLSNYVRDIMTQLLAITIKRASVNTKSGADRESMYNHLAQLLSSDDQPKQFLATSVLSSLCTEFAVTTKSSNVSITWEQHIHCKKQFENFDIHKIFELVLQVLHHILTTGRDSMFKSATSLCGKFLQIAHQILSWNFVSVGSRRSLMIYDDTLKVSFQPDSKWKKIVHDPQLLKLFFHIHIKCRENEDVCHLSLLCLSQLATIEGTVMRNKQDEANYLNHFIQSFLHIYASGSCHNYETLHVANVISNIFDAHKLQVWSHTPELMQLFNVFLDCFTKLTAYICAKAAEDEMLDEDDQCFTEAFDVLLNTWTTIISMLGDVEIQTLIAPRARFIVESYIYSHLAPPAGKRLKDKHEDDDIDEMEEEDRLKFSSVLISIASLGRTNLVAILPALIELLGQRVDHLSNLLESNTVVPEDTVNDLNEDVHWLVLLSGYLLADEAVGETSQIPSEIMQFSAAQSKQCDQNKTLVMMCSPQATHKQTPINESIDHVVRLISTILRLAHVLTNALKHNKMNYLSPQVFQDVLWCIQSVSSSYLIFKEELYDEISPTLSFCFGEDSDGGKWLVNFIVHVLTTVFTMWSSEILLLDEAGHLLITLVDNSKRCLVVTSCGEFWTFSSSFCKGNMTFDLLPPIVRRQVMSAVITAGSSNMNLYKDKYWQETLEPVKTRYQKLVSQANFKKVAFAKDSMQELAFLLDLMRGIAEATSPANTDSLFIFLSLVLQDGKVILELYKDYQNIVISLLELFVELAHRQICYLSNNRCNELYNWTLNLLRAYSSCFTVRQHSKDEEEDAFQDISLIIELLSHLLSKDFIDFSDDQPEQSHITLETKQAPTEKVEVSDVVLFGLQIILPHINSQLLMFPSLCSQYFKLVTFMCELYPEKVGKLSDDMLRAFMQTLQLGLSSYGVENCKLSLEGILALGEQCLETKANPDKLHHAIQPFFKLVFDVVMVHSSDMKLLQTSSDTFFILCCYSPQLVTQMLQQVVGSQTDDSLKARLNESFGKLITPQLVQLDHRPSHNDKLAFSKTLEEVVFDIRGILCVK